MWAIVENRLGNKWFGSWGNGLTSYDGNSFNKKKVGQINNYYMGTAQTADGFLLPYSGGVVKCSGSKMQEFAIPNDNYLYTYTILRYKIKQS
ncbi:MAG: hypothetical protein ACK5L5_07420 [Bacteroidales bacterium]